MKKQIDLTEAIGQKLVNQIHSTDGSSIILLFENGFVKLGIRFGYEDGDEEIEEQVFNLNYSAFNKQILIENGIITKDEYLNHMEKMRKQQEEIQKKRDLAEYKRLKNLFEK